MIATLVLHAAARGIVLRGVSAEIEGDVDVRGALGLDETVKPEFLQIRVRLNVETDCSDAELAELIDYAQEHAAVTNSLRRPVPVLLEQVRTARVFRPLLGRVRAVCEGVAET